MSDSFFLCLYVYKLKSICFLSITKITTSVFYVLLNWVCWSDVWNILKLSSIYLFSCLFLQEAYAGYAGELKINRVYTNDSGSTYIGTSIQPANTCSSWGEYFTFDSTTAGGKNILSILLSAEVSGQSGQSIDVWYTNSSTPGTNQTNGCSLYTLTAVGLSKNQ